MPQLTVRETHASIFWLLRYNELSVSPTGQGVIKFYPRTLASMWSNVHEMTATLVRTMAVSATQQCSCTHSPLCMGISYIKKKNSSCSTPTLQPCCLSSRIPCVPLKKCWFVSIEEVQGKTTQHIPKITLKSQYRMLGKTGTSFESLYYCRRGVHQR